MSFTVPYHSPSTTYRVRQSVLERPCTGLRAIYRMCNILPPHNPRDNLIKLSS